MVDKPSGSTLAYGLLVVAMMIWGVSWPVARVVMFLLPLFWVTLVRHSMVVLGFFLVLRLREGSIRIPRVWIARCLVLGFFGTTLWQVLTFWGVKMAAASDAVMVMGLIQVLVIVLAPFLVGERLTAPKLTGLAFGGVGIFIISALSPNTEVLNRPLGVLVTAAAAVVLALYTLFLRRFRMRQDGPSTLAIVTWATFLGWLFLLPPVLLEAPPVNIWRPEAWFGMLYLALMSSILGFLLHAHGVARLGAGRTAIFFNLWFVFGVVSAFFLLHEAVNMWHGASFALVFAGVALVVRRCSVVSMSSSRMKENAPFPVCPACRAASGSYPRLNRWDVSSVGNSSTSCPAPVAKDSDQPHALLRRCTRTKPP